MNGRMYDPAVGRFLSADPFVQDAGNTQHYNRYTYCSNNPLRYTDPSGYTQAEMWTAQMTQEMLAGLGGWATALGYSVNNSIGSSSGDGFVGSGSSTPRLDRAMLISEKEYEDRVNAEIRKKSETFVSVGFYYHDEKGNPVVNENGDSGEFWIYEANEFNDAIGAPHLGGWLDNLQTGLDIAGIADPTGVVDLGNALIYAGRRQWGNAGISAMAIIPYIGDAGKVARLGNKTLQLTSKARTAERGLDLAGKFLKPGYSEIAPGVFRSSDQLRQFRMTTADITGAHGSGPHFNFEIYSPLNLNKAVKNYHVPISNY